MSKIECEDCGIFIGEECCYYVIGNDVFCGERVDKYRYNYEGLEHEPIIWADCGYEIPDEDNHYMNGNTHICSGCLEEEHKHMYYTEWPEYDRDEDNIPEEYR